MPAPAYSAVQRSSWRRQARIAEVVYEAATDGKQKLRYVAGADAKAAYEQRLAVGAEAFCQGLDRMVFG